MRDALNNFGSIALTGSAVTLPDVIDFGAKDPRYPLANHQTGEQHDSTVVFSIDGTVSAAVTGLKLQHSDDNSSFADLAGARDLPASSPAGSRSLMPFPLEHKRYVRAVASGGTAGVKVSVWFEPGPNH
jgi:hypothetical protein